MTEHVENRKFVEDALKAHNEYRQRHKVAPLKLNRDVTGKAQKWAEHLASTGSFQHSSDRSHGGDSMGENIAMKWTSGGADFTGQQVTNQWYSEVSKYNYSHGGGSGTGHFTQVVWKDSREFGIGRARGRDGKWIVVGNYVPAGNFMGRYQENVFSPKDGKTSLIGDDAPSTAGAPSKSGLRIFSSQPSKVQGHRVVPQGHQAGGGHNVVVQVHRGDRHTPVTSYTRSQPKVEQNTYQIHCRGYGEPTNQRSHSSHGYRVQYRQGYDNEKPAIASCGFSSDDFPSDGFSREGFSSGGFSSSGFPSGGFKNFSGFDSGRNQNMASSGNSSSGGGRVVSRQTKTVTEGCGANKKTRTIVTETIVEPDGSRKTVTNETVTTGN